MTVPTADMGVIPGDSLGDRVRGLRLERGLTQEELAGSRFSKEYLSQIERGVSKPTRTTITWLADRLGADVSYLETGVGGELELVERAEELLERQEYAAVCEVLEGAQLPAALQLRALLAESWARMYLGELEEALALLQGGAALVPDAVALAEVVYRMGCCEYKRSEVDAAELLFSEALSLAVEGGAPDRLRAHIYEWRSRCYRRRRDWPAAGEDVERALELAEAAGDRMTQAHATFQASLLAERKGELASARRLAKQAREIYAEQGDRQNEGRLLNNVGAYEHLLGNSERAEKCLQESFATALDLGNDADAAQAVSSLARVQLDSGRLDLAEKNARHAIQLLAERVDYLDELGSTQIVLGRALLELGRTDEAEACFAQAEESFSRLASASHTAAAWTAQGDLALHVGDEREAREHFRRAAIALEEIDLEGREVI
jgi:tetratricopeptide (TPR) repeat protein